jgi:hypothetical protein
MFSQEQSINEWRRQMAARGISTAKVLDELESHLRDDIQRQTRSGERPEKAFEVAVSRIGDASALKAEFVNAGRSRGALEKLMIAICVVLVVLISLLSAAGVVLCYTSLADRIMASVAFVCILFAACRWSLAVPFLPVIANKSRRTVMAIACILAGMGISTVYCQVILPHFMQPYAQQVPAAGVWMVFPIALGFGLGCGLHQAGRNQRTQAAT